MSGKSILVFLLAIVLVYLSIRATVPPPVMKSPISDTAFSVQRAYSHLVKISAAPHPTGSAENEVVRAYIISMCKRYGFEVEVQNSLSIRDWHQYVRAGNIYNIIARKKGVHPSKSVVLMAHYDSEPNTAGAGDDGAAIAAILETASALQNAGPLQNDLVLLFTDGEEIGLLGANAFVKQSPLVKDIGLVINFEGRGNAGPSNMFEVNAQNGWAVSEYAKAAAHPFANSLGYEVYKKLPNSTDYTIFKDSGITGLNNAYIDGFVNYHSPNDKPENLNLGSLQHHGENMFSLTKHFGNMNIGETKSEDISYFNPIGFWLVHYPASWNILFVLLTNILFVAYLVIGLKKRKTGLTGFAVSALAFPAAMAILYFTASFLLRRIIVHYPYYGNFDEHNSYNSGWYFFTMSALAVAVFSALYWALSRKAKFHSLLAGILLIAIVLTDIMQYLVPSASYLLFVPVIFILVFQLIRLYKTSDETNLSTTSHLLNLASVVPAVCIISPTLYYAFIAFALGANMPFVAVGVLLVTGLLLPVVFPVLRGRIPWMVVVAFICVVTGLLGAHVNAGFSAKHPLQSSVFYDLDTDLVKATWRSEFRNRDQWSSQFFKNSKPVERSSNGFVVNGAPVAQLASPIATILKDTIINGSRNLQLHISSMRPGVTWMELALRQSSQVGQIDIEQNHVKLDRSIDNQIFDYRGAGEAGFNINFQLPAQNKLDLTVKAGSVGLPTFNGFDTRYPPGVIPAQGKNSNTTQVSKHFIF